MSDVSSEKQSFADPRSDTLPDAEADFVYTTLTLTDALSVETEGFLHGLLPDMAWPDGSKSKRRYFVGDIKKVDRSSPENDQPIVIRVPRVKDFGTEAYTGRTFRETPVPAEQIEILGKDGRWYQIKIPPATILGAKPPQEIPDYNIAWTPADPRSVLAPGPVVVLKERY